jgi:hypothetical protein
MLGTFQLTRRTDETEAFGCKPRALAMCGKLWL